MPIRRQAPLVMQARQARQRANQQLRKAQALWPQVVRAERQVRHAARSLQSTIAAMPPPSFKDPFSPFKNKPIDPFMKKLHDPSGVDDPREWKRKYLHEHKELEHIIRRYHGIFRKFHAAHHHWRQLEIVARRLEVAAGMRKPPRRDQGHVWPGRRGTA